ncbi:MAG: hypothetical protein V4677_13980 [Bacteroidota bacterium]
MKTPLLLTLILTCLFNFNFKAQDNTAFEKGTIVATAGYGFPDLYRTNLRVSYNGYSSRTIRGFGPLILKGDYGIVKFKWGHSVGAGIVIGYSSTKVEYINNYYGPIAGVYTETDNYRTITIGARGTYHFYTKEKIDCYASIGLGYNINSFTQTHNNPNGYYARTGNARAGLYSAFTVGIRYYFTKNIGVYAEGGWDMSAPIQGGVAIKF